MTLIAAMFAAAAACLYRIPHHHHKPTDARNHKCPQQQPNQLSTSLFTSLTVQMQMPRVPCFADFALHNRMLA